MAEAIAAGGKSLEKRNPTPEGTSNGFNPGTFGTVRLSNQTPRKERPSFL